jgi:hypothetical protein
MSARTVLNEAEKHGVKVTLNAAGDGLSLSAPKKPPAALLARLFNRRPERGIWANEISRQNRPRNRLRELDAGLSKRCER